MGVSINLHVYPRVRLVGEIDEYVLNNGGYRDGALHAQKFLEAVGNEFGRLTDEEFLVVWNEYYDEYNPASNFLRAVEDYYFPNQRDAFDDGDLSDFWASGYSTYSGGANASEVLADVFPSEFDYGGTFSEYGHDE